MSKKAASTKPPTQIASAEGIAPKPITMNEEARLDWNHIVRLPPFQMFAAERMKNTSGADSESHAKMFASAHWSSSGLYDSYCQWHREKGYWPNETAMGELIAVEGDTLTA